VYSETNKGKKENIRVWNKDAKDREIKTDESGFQSHAMRFK